MNSSPEPDLSETLLEYEQLLAVEPESSPWPFALRGGTARQEWLKELLLSGVATVGFDQAWLRRQIERLSEAPRFDVVKLIASAFADEAQIGLRPSWANYSIWGKPAGELDLRLAEDRYPLGHIVGGEWELLERTGSGGFGVVYRARRVSDSAEGALKAPRADSPQLELMRFRQLESEAHSLRLCAGTGVPELLDSFVADGVPVLVMEFVDGGSVEAPTPYSADDSFRIAAGVAEIVDRVNRLGLLHGDIKPSNVKLSSNGKVYLLDFGLGRSDDPSFAVDGVQPGTLAFMSPESIVGVGDELDVRQDVYALGAFLFQLATALPLHAGSSREDSLVASLFGGDSNPHNYPEGVPESLPQIVDTAIDRRPDARYETAGDFAGACREAAVQGNVEGPPSAHRRELTAFRLGLELGRLAAEQYVLSISLATLAVEPNSLADFKAATGALMYVPSLHERLLPLAARLRLELPHWPHSLAFRQSFYSVRKKQVAGLLELAVQVDETSAWVDAAWRFLNQSMGQIESPFARLLFQWGFSGRAGTVMPNERPRWIALANQLNASPEMLESLGHLASSNQPVTREAWQREAALWQYRMIRRLRWEFAERNAEGLPPLG